VRASEPVKTWVARFGQERIEDFEKSMEQLLDGMFTRQILTEGVDTDARGISAVAEDYRCRFQGRLDLVYGLA